MFSMIPSTGHIDLPANMVAALSKLDEAQLPEAWLRRRSRKRDRLDNRKLNSPCQEADPSPDNPVP